MKILVTGGLGFIGHNVARLLDYQGHNVKIIDSITDYGFVPKLELDYLIKQRQHRLGKHTTTSVMDIRESRYIDRIFHHYRPDCVIHLASFPRQKVVSQMPLVASDVMCNGLVNLLEATRSNNVEKFVYVSSSMVYGDFDSNTDETETCRPTGQYAIMKLMGEHLVADYSKRAGFDHVIVRPSAVYGEWDVNDRVVSKFFTQALLGKELVVKGPKEILDFTHVEDTAQGIVLAAIKSCANTCYNITRSNTTEYNLEMAANLIVDLVGQGTVKLTDRDQTFPSRGRLNIDRARSDLGYNPTIDIEEGFKRYHEWFLQNSVLWN